jgi:hypothetical protein
VEQTKVSTGLTEDTAKYFLCDASSASKMNGRRKYDRECRHKDSLYCFLCTFTQPQKPIISFVMSACLSTWNLVLTGWILMKLYISASFKNLSKEFKCHQTQKD